MLSAALKLICFHCLCLFNQYTGGSAHRTTTHKSNGGGHTDEGDPHGKRSPINTEVLQNVISHETQDGEARSITGMVDLRSGEQTRCLPAGQEIQNLLNRPSGGAHCFSYRSEEHGEEVDHGLHVEAPLGSHAGRRQEHQAADRRKQQLGDVGTHGWDPRGGSRSLSRARWVSQGLNEPNDARTSTRTLAQSGGKKSPTPSCPVWPFKV